MLDECTWLLHPQISAFAKATADLAEALRAKAGADSRIQ
jgi:hypothetical protein